MFLTFNFSILAKYFHLHLVLFPYAGVNEWHLSMVCRHPPLSCIPNQLPLMFFICSLRLMVLCVWMQFALFTEPMLLHTELEYHNNFNFIFLQVHINFIFFLVHPSFKPLKCENEKTKIEVCSNFLKYG